MYGDQEVVIETGRIARQATASVLVTMAENPNFKYVVMPMRI